MTDQLLRKGRGRRAVQLAGALLAIAGAGTMGGCLNRPLEPNEPRTTSTIVEPFTQSSVDKIDLVLMLDNSRSMADKQLILAAAVPDLVGALVNPKCLDMSGVAAMTQPTGPLDMCPPGTKREFPPVANIHIGIVSSSLGGHGSDSCSTAETQSCNGSPNPSNNDAGHLLSRQNACGGQNIGTYQNKGFLAWDPGQKLMPPGEKDIGAIAYNPMTGTEDTTMPGIVATLKDMVLGVDQIGCGYEAQLEGWYRFLIDPEPYKDITVQGGKATPSGTDQILLQQRADFLRPSSLLAIIMLTDENDCSVRESGQFYYAVQQRNPADNKKAFHLPRARKECQTNPNDPCCKSCGQKADACPADAMCTSSPTLSDLEDDINLRCWDQKRRFGIDFLYGVDRYTQGLTQLTVQNRQGDLVQNPIFTDLNPNDEDSNVRDAGLVFIAGIVGVPWQDIARDPNDLTKGFKNSDELAQKDKSGTSTWDTILGDPANYVAPKDPHMVESIVPRMGLPGPMSAPNADPFNGHEYSIPKNDDLQYACAFDLPKSRDCAGGKLVSCDCQDPMNDNPLCDTTTKTTQLRAKAYPGIRELATLQSVGAQGIVGSICPKQLDNDKATDYGYRPAIGAIIDRLKTALGGQCLPRTLTPDKLGEVPCLILEARNTGGKGTCSLMNARQPVSADHKAAIDAAQAYPIYKTAKWDTYCEIIQTGDPVNSSPEELKACQTDSSAQPIIMGGKSNGANANGWCYVDPAQNSASNPDIVKDCPATEKRLIRFVGNGNPVGNATLFITCTGD
jgi:hypothetical protein